MKSIISVGQAARIMREAMSERLRAFWVWYFVQGALTALAGVIGLTLFALSQVSLTVPLAYLVMISGVLQAASLIGCKNMPHFWLQLATSALSLMIGIFILRDPSIVPIAFTFLIVVYFMTSGMTRLVFALTIRPFPNWGWMAASGLFGIALGAVFFAQLGSASAAVVSLMLGAQLFVDGMGQAFVAWSTRRHSQAD